MSEKQHFLLHSSRYGDLVSLRFQGPGYGGTEEIDSTEEHTEALMLSSGGEEGCI